MLKAVIFDKDGVLVQTSELHFEKWKIAFAKYGRKITREFYIKNISGRSAFDNLKVHFSFLRKDELNKLHDEQLNFIVKEFDTYVTLVPGILDFLRKLKKTKLSITLATSSRLETTNYMLEKFKMRSYFDMITTSNETSKSKPHPEIYLLAAQKLGIKPSECVVFEDSYFGVESAKKAGMKVILVMTNNTKKDIPDVEMAIRDFTEITVNDLKMI